MIRQGPGGRRGLLGWGLLSHGKAFVSILNKVGAQPALQEPGPVVATGWRTQAEASVVEMRSAGAGMLFPEGGPERGEG